MPPAGTCQTSGSSANGAASLAIARAVLLRELPHGDGIIIDVLVGTFVGDTGAHLGGRMIGTRALAPRISPNKTAHGGALDPVDADRHRLLRLARAALVRQLMPFLRRLAFAPVVFLVVAAFTYGLPRILLPELFPGEEPLEGAARDLNRALLLLDFGCARVLPGCPSIHDLWVQGMAWDLWLIAGALVLGVATGIPAGVWCARRPRSLRARALESAAAVAYCAPVFFVGLLALWLFNPTYGQLPLPAFFDAEPRWVSPWDAPWDWFRQLLVPWIVLAAPLAGMCLRLTLATTREAMDEDFVRTAAAKGVAHDRVVRRHAAPLSYAGTFSFVGVSAPLVITNMVLVELTLSVPGFFRHTWRAAGHAQALRRGLADAVPDLPLLCALTLWGAVLLIVVGLIADGIVSYVDPRVRMSSAQAW